MSIREGVYPGCTAVSGVAEVGRSIVVQVPGYPSTVRAIAASAIRSPNNLTLTIDGTGVARAFGVGSVETQSRTTEFYRSVRRSIPVRLIEWLIHWTKTVLPQTGTIAPLLNNAVLPAEEFTGQLPGQRLHYRGKGTSEESTTIAAEFKPSFDNGGYLQAMAIAELQAVSFEVEAALEVTPPPPPTPPGVFCEMPEIPPCERLDYVLVEISAPRWMGIFTPDDPDEPIVEEVREAFSDSFYVIYPQAENRPPADGRDRLLAQPQTGALESVCQQYGDVELLLTDTTIAVQLRLGFTNYHSDLNIERVTWYNPPRYGAGVIEQSSEGSGVVVIPGYFEHPEYVKTVNYTFHYGDRIIRHGTRCYGIPVDTQYQADLFLQLGIVEAVSDLPDLNDLMEDSYDTSPYVAQLMQLNKLPQFFYQLHLRKDAAGNSKERFFQKESTALSDAPGMSIAEAYSPEKFAENFSSLSGNHLLIVKALFAHQVEVCSAQFKLLIRHP